MNLAKEVEDLSSENYKTLRKEIEKTPEDGRYQKMFMDWKN
jgi:hypothetical protein